MRKWKYTLETWDMTITAQLLNYKNAHATKGPIYNFDIILCILRHIMAHCVIKKTKLLVLNILNHNKWGWWLTSFAAYNLWNLFCGFIHVLNGKASHILWWSGVIVRIFEAMRGSLIKLSCYTKWLPFRWNSTFVAKELRISFLVEYVGMYVIIYVFCVLFMHTPMC